MRILYVHQLIHDCNECVYLTSSVLDEYYDSELTGEETEEISYWCRHPEMIRNCFLGSFSSLTTFIESGIPKRCPLMVADDHQIPSNVIFQ